MKTFLIAIAIIASLLSGNSFAGEEGLELPVTYHRQHTQVWCWAAAVAMMVDYYQNYPVSDCVVLTEFALRNGGRESCCTNPSACTTTGSIRDMTGMMSGIYGIHGSVIDRPLAYRELVREIDAGRPVIAALSDDKGGHIVVISGYVLPDRVVVLDPLRGRKVASLNDLVRKGVDVGTWQHTFLFSSVRSREPLCGSFEEVVVSPGLPPSRQDRVRCSSNGY